MTPKPSDFRRIALINLGGIGDGILFSPVMAELKQWLPNAQLTLILENRSAAVAHLLPVDKIVEIEAQKGSKPALFFKLLQLLRQGRYDAVFCSGRTPIIPMLLFLSGIRNRIGFKTGPVSRTFLTVEAPLYAKGYAGLMYFSMAEAFLKRLLGKNYIPRSPVLPSLLPISAEETAWAKTLMTPGPMGQKDVLLHPGVSRISLEKGIIKTWPISHWIKLIERLSQQHRVFLVGGPDDAQTITDVMATLPTLPVSQFVNLYGQTKSLTQLAALIQQADLLVCVDSSPMHIAVAYGTPVVCIFGPTDEKKLMPPAGPYRAVRREDLRCRPCLWDQRAQNCATSDCLQVEVDAVLQETAEVLTT